MEEMKRQLIPSYMHRFACSGSSCEDTCCSGWRVTLDQRTYKKYNKLRGSEMKSELDEHVKRNRSNPTSRNYAHIAMNSQLTCPFLNNDKLCNVQLVLGEEYLSNICSQYPRISNEVDNLIETSLSMSCPEAARLALINPQGIQFDEIENVLNNRTMINNKINTMSAEKHKSLLEQNFWDLRFFTIQLLQNRAYTLAERLIILGIFYQKAQQYIDQKEVQNIPQLIASYAVLLSEEGLKETFEEIPTSSLVQMQLIKKLTDIRINQGIQSQRYLDCFTEFLRGIHYSDYSTLEEISLRYEDAFNSYYYSFMSEHEYILENYLVNYVFKNLFPLGDDKNIFDEYIMLVIHFSMIKMHLIGMAGYHKENFCLDNVLKLIQSFARTVEHFPAYLQEIKELLRSNGFNTMAYMAILIKNN